MPPRTDIPAETIEWLTSAENPAVAVLARRSLLGEPDSPELETLWGQRNRYAPLAAIIDELPALIASGVRDYQKYRGPLWQAHFLGELWADGDDARLKEFAEYAFTRQLADGSWSCRGGASGSIPCLTANVGRGLARMGCARDERIVKALAWVADVVQTNGFLACPPGGTVYTLNAYCHMVAPKLLLFLAQVPQDLWPAGAAAMRDECVRVLRQREVYRCLPHGSRAFQEYVYKRKPAEIPALRDEWIAEHGALEYAEKPGWLRFGYPLSYNSDALEALFALAGVGEQTRPEYEPALELVRASADPQLRWRLRNSLNGKMVADIERKGQPSRWLTLRALQVLRHFDTTAAAPTPQDAEISR